MRNFTPFAETKQMLLRRNGLAVHKLGDISRHTFDAELIYVTGEDGDSWVGHFAEGMGFVCVRFLKSDCREATEEEIELCDKGRMREIRY